ncbi:DUF397 domain-containing protein [Micromonospora sp. WMMD987]|uniref:DUF397 domain-containing protein n=1 Tax=Micromonospora sp. WMMD987 TaxID=3016089 RepID=UPI002499C6F9|nr:DUF397 domain-containing protein [Micromonospora sp. WMMD987]WFE96818.1 DUF397 domain-containing protein [Micromonospora sp. WMMD987]
MNDPVGACWRKSTHSAEGACVEVADGLAVGVGVRDSKDTAGPALVFSAQSWRIFLREIKEKDHG